VQLNLIGYRCNDGKYGVLAQQDRSQKLTEMLREALAILTTANVFIIVKSMMLFIACPAPKLSYIF
jgi:hypothetical protein